MNANTINTNPTNPTNQVKPILNTTRPKNTESSIHSLNSSEPNNTPNNTPNNISNNTPKNTPGNTPSNTPNNTPGSSNSPHSGLRCFVCNKKLKLIDQTMGLCKCGNLFCPKHRCVRDSQLQMDPRPDKEKNCHTCSWDYIKEQQQILQKNNPNITASKINRV